MSFKDYSSTKLIGNGSFGIVHLAVKKPCAVVIKEMLLNNHGDPKLLVDAKNEAAALARCSHPNIVRVFNVFVDKEKPSLCIEMEFCEGGDLSKAISERNASKQPFDEPDLKDWLAQLALAVSYIHDQNIIHRDIKPHNIFLSANKKIVKLGDFGIVKFLDKAGGNNPTMTMRGTPSHMPPEVLRNVSGQQMVVDFKFDVWSLGVVLFELATFQLPFQYSQAHMAHMQVLEAIRRNKLPSMPACYTAELRNITMRMLTVDVKKRATMSEIVNDSYLLANVQAHSKQIVSDDWTQILKGEIKSLKEELAEVKQKLEEEVKLRNEISSSKARLEIELREAKEKYRELKSSVRNGTSLSNDDDKDEHATATRQLSIDEKKKLADGLFTAVQSGSIRETNKMLHKGADVNMKDSTGWTALIRAARYGRTEVAELLLEKGASLDTKNNDGWTALHVAACYGVTETARMLIGHNADVNSRNNEGWTPLITASSNGRTETVEILLDNGGDISARNHDGWTALHVAACNGRADAVALLIKRQADLNLRNKDGWTALMYAASNGRDETVKLLWENGADLHLKNNEGLTALVISCRYQRTETVNFLIDCGADVNSKDNNGKYPYYHAKNDDVRRIIIAAGGKQK